MRIWRGMIRPTFLRRPRPKQGSPIHPRSKETGLSGPFSVTRGKGYVGSDYYLSPVEDAERVRIAR